MIVKIAHDDVYWRFCYSVDKMILSLYLLNVSMGPVNGQWDFGVTPRAFWELILNVIDFRSNFSF